MRLRTALAALLALPAPLAAQTGLPAGQAQTVPFTTSYTGPGDLVPGASEWWGLRAYSAAYAASGGNAVQLTRASDSATANIAVLGNGSLDSAAAAAFCASTSCAVSVLYDQTGNGYHLTGSGTGRPAYTPGCIGSLPCIAWTAADVLSNGSYPGAAQPFSFSAVLSRTGNYTTAMSYLLTSGATFTQFGFHSAANTTRLASTSGTTTGSGADNAFHSLHAVFNAASSYLDTDGTSVTGTNAGLIGAGSGGPQLGANSLTGNSTETGVWLSALTTAQANALCHNQNAYYTLGLSC